MRSKVSQNPGRPALVLCALFLAACALTGVMRAQQAAPPERKVVKRVQPEYPMVLRSKGIGGTVKLEVTVTAGGTVKAVQVLGGNAILAESAQHAVRQWVFAAGERETKNTVVIEFNPETH